MSDNRTKILQRIINLRAKAEDAGSSEAEMNVAMNMCQKLMDAYDVAEAELAMAEASGEIKLEIVTRTAKTNGAIYANPNRTTRPQMHEVARTAAMAIAAFTDTKVIYNGFSGELTYTGHLPDVEWADYLTGIIRNALEREYENWKNSMGHVGFGAKKSFQRAMAVRIYYKLMKMADERKNSVPDAVKAIENAATASSTALVVKEFRERKLKEVEKQFRIAHPRTSRARSGGSGGRNSTAHGAGYEAGDRFNVGDRPIGGTSTKAIGAC